MAKIIVIDDSKSIRTNLHDILSDEGHEIEVAADGKAGLEMITDKEVDLVLLDVKLPGMDGIEVLKRIKHVKPEIEVILISGHGTIATAVEAMRAGAYDFVEKPLSMERVLIMADHALERRKFNRERQIWLQRQDNRYQMIGESGVMKRIWEEIKSVATTNARVLITGESGTGKELVSYWLHRFSKRYRKPLVKVNCAAIPNELIESELFGYEKGAFTGAHQRKIGKFELARDGTIFLDEIGDMAMQTQAKVLRIIEDGEFLRIGGLSRIKVDVRIVAATNKDLPKEIKNGSFREDLYHRINVFQIYLPPLRERRKDIPLLANHLIKQYCYENGFRPKKLTKEAQSYLVSLTYPGNIRELKNIIERAIIVGQGDTILPQDLRFGKKLDFSLEQDIFTMQKPLSEAKVMLEKRYLEKQLSLNDWNIAQTARKLGVQRSNLSRRIKQLGIEKQKRIDVDE
jgi:two-component system nitrogen regulation response regulator NtrX